MLLDPGVVEHRSGQVDVFHKNVTIMSRLARRQVFGRGRDALDGDSLHGRYKDRGKSN